MANEKITDPSEPLDYRLGGETWDSWALKYMATIPYIFRVLNAINGTDDTGVVLPLPSGAGALVRKNADGSVTITVHGNADSADKLKTARTITLAGKAQGSVSFDGSSDVTINVSNVSGNAESLVGKPINTTYLSDGKIPVYRASTNQIEFEDKGTVGAGKALTISDGTQILGSYSGDVATNIDIGPVVHATPQSAEEATRLATARSINGTPFDGSENIVTARWGAAQSVTIKDASATNAGTSATVDGSGSINLTLPATIKANIVGNVTGNYATCSTAAATAAKTVSVSGFALVTGASVRVKFANTNTASNPTLNVSNTGAKAIYSNGSAISPGMLSGNTVIEFVYDGTHYNMMGGGGIAYNIPTQSGLGNIWIE